VTADKNMSPVRVELAASLK